MGGEEFAVLLPSTNGKDACGLAQKIRGIVEKIPFDYDRKTFGITMSFGISESNYGINKEISLQDLLKLADQRLYYSKEHGRNRVTYLEDVSG